MKKEYKGYIDTIVDIREIPEYSSLPPSKLAKVLKKIHKKDIDRFHVVVETIPDEVLGDILLELPENIRNIILADLTTEELKEVVEELETDDATDLIQDIEELDQNKADEVLNSLDKEEQDDIKWLKRYEEDQAGAFMQTELFEANLNETVYEAKENLKELKESGELENIYQVFVVDDNKSLVATIPLEDLIIMDFNLKFIDIVNLYEDKFKPVLVDATMDIEDVIKLFEDYDLSVAPVVGYKGRLLGRITSDDMYDIIEDSATEQIYNLAGVNEDTEYEDSFVQTVKNRANWLLINLFTAILASLVIGIFDETIQSLVALAVLMPIVASMGGNAGTQTLTVIVRQLALGEIEYENSKEAIKKEVLISLFNGFVFALIAGVITYFWFSIPLLGAVIGMSMIINLFFAGFFGSIIPILLKKFNIDPAIGSTVILTTITDIAGFFSFLGLAQYFIL
jgi:magnesium transporter